MFSETKTNWQASAHLMVSNLTKNSEKSESSKNLRCWLVDMINSNEIPGLQWEDLERKIFRIPWKHAGKNDWKEEDCKIFKAWAQHKGKYQQGDKVEAAIWKTRFRCALHKLSDIQELKDRSDLSGEDPHRVYQLVSGSSNNSFLCDSTMSKQNTIHYQMDVTPTPVYNWQSPNFHGTPSNKCTTGACNYQDIQNKYAYETGCSNISEPSKTVNDIRSGDCQQFGKSERNVCIAPPLLPPEPHEMEIHIKYRGVTVAARHVIEPRGCRIYYGDASLQHIAAGNHPTGNMLEPESLDQIRLVECESFASSKRQISLTKDVLKSINRGLILSYDREKFCFYAERLCKSSVFICGPESPDKIPENLQRKTKVMVFDYKKFFDKLKKYDSGCSPKLPKAELHVSFAQSWTIKSSIEKNLVTFCMVPRAAKFMINKNRDKHGDSSIHDNTIQEYFSYDNNDSLAERAIKQTSKCIDELIRDISIDDISSQLIPVSNYHQPVSSQNTCDVKTSGYFQKNAIQIRAPPAMEGVEMSQHSSYSNLQYSNVSYLRH